LPGGVECYTADMKTNGNDKTLESYKIFPFLAWILVIGFAFFVYTIAMDLKDTADRLGAQADLLEGKSRSAAGEIVDFDQQVPNN
jgi:hypothetical protein